MGVWSFLSGVSYKAIQAKVTTMDADLEKIVFDASWTGRHLFDAVCRIIGLREMWFFGLQFTNKKGLPCWLQMDKEIRKQEVPKDSGGVMQFLFLVKFYPEFVEEELIQDLTRHLFFVQIKQAILSMDLYCSPEASVLLASFAVQAIHGDCPDDVSMLELEKLLPKSVIEQYDMSEDMWRERIKRWWLHNQSQSREDAEMEYLRVAQDLEMYGILYYPIQNQKETDLHLGISAQGLGIYKGTNRITPRPFFSWSEIKNIVFKSGRFHMKTVDKSTISFRALEKTINPSILDLCIGTHNLYLRRRQPDTLEVQQMRAQAKEERTRRQLEASRLSHEREEKEQAETEKNNLRAEVERVAEELEKAKETIRRTEESASMLADKARTSEQEAMLSAKRASNAEAEFKRLQSSHVKSEEALMRMEQKAREAELYAERIYLSLSDVNNTNSDIRKPHYASHALISELSTPMWPNTGGQLHSTVSQQQLMTSSALQGDEIRAGLGYWQPSGIGASAGQFGQQQIVVHAAPPDPAMNHIIEFHNLRNEVEKSRKEYTDKQIAFQDRLREFRSELEAAKRDERMTEHDIIHQQNQQNGCDKQTTLRMRPVASPVKRQAAKPVAPTGLTVSEFYQLEDETAKSEGHKALETAFLEQSAVVRAMLKDIVEGKSEEKLPKTSVLNAIKMRQCSKHAWYATGLLRKDSAKLLEEAETKHLQLQNANSEIQHIKKEINRCLQFSAGDEELDLVSTEEFYEKAPESISKPEMTKSDEHEQYLARLQYEIQQRKDMLSTLGSLEARKSALVSDINGKEQRLKSLKPAMENFIKAAKPVQEALGMRFTPISSVDQRSLFAHLPQALSGVYVQAEAYRDLLEQESNMTVTIVGKPSTSAGAAPIEDKSDDETEEAMDHDGGSHAEGHSRFQQTKETVLRPHPLHLIITIQTIRDINVTLKLHYMPQLRVVTLRTKLDSNMPTYGGLCSADDLLVDLLCPDDDGSECPDPIGRAKLDQLNLTATDISSKLGRPYRFAQSLWGGPCAGQEFSGVQAIDALKNVLEGVKLRVADRITLVELLKDYESVRNSLEGLPTTTQMKSFSMVSQEDFEKMASLTVNTEKYYFIASLENSHGIKVNAYLGLCAAYPRTPSRIALSFTAADGISKNSEQSKLVKEIETIVNDEGMKSPDAMVLNRQMKLLIERIDIVKEC